MVRHVKQSKHINSQTTLFAGIPCLNLRKSIHFVLAGLLALSLAACGGGSSSGTTDTEIFSYTVVTTVDSHGSIHPASVNVNSGSTIVLTINPDAGYGIESVTGCGGHLSGNTYTTGAITADCAVTATYAILIPQELRATGVDEQAALAWAAIDGATDFCVYVSENPGITLENVASYDISLSGCLGTTAAKYAVTGLTNGTAYYFAITAKVGSEESPLSNEVNATVGKQINDTGVTKCGNTGWIIPLGLVSLDCAETGATKTEPGIDSYGTTVPQGQDAFYGRDADTHLAKVGGGKAGFDFTRICNNGEAEGEGICPAGMTVDYIGDGANQWACNRDNVTGLMWEVKSTDSTHLRYYGHTYSFFKLVNDGVLTSRGTENNGTCHDAINCDTDKFTIAVNANGGICGFNDWRMPMKEELRSILFLGAHTPAADTDYFPDTNPDPTDPFPFLASWYWSADVYIYPGYAYSVEFRKGEDVYSPYASALRVRLVRSTGTSIFTVSAP